MTFTDLSPAASGQMIAVHKVIAICDWMQVAVRAFYLKPSEVDPLIKSNSCNGSIARRASVERLADTRGMEP